MRKRGRSSEHNHLGVTFYQSGALDLALEQFKRATKRAPWVASYWVNLGVVLLDKQDCAHAEAALNRAIELQPDNQSAHFYLAQLNACRGDKECARFFYDRVIEINPDSRLGERAREQIQHFCRSGKSEPTV